MPSEARRDFPPWKRSRSLATGMCMDSSSRLLNNRAWFDRLYAHLAKFFFTLANSRIGKLFWRVGFV